MICDFFHPNNSQKPPIARPYGGGWGIFKFIVSITFYLLRCPLFQYHIVFERDISGVFNTGNQFPWIVRGRNSDFTVRLSYSIQLEMITICFIWMYATQTQFAWLNDFRELFILSITRWKFMSFYHEWYTEMYRKCRNILCIYVKYIYVILEIYIQTTILFGVA